MTFRPIARVLEFRPRETPTRTSISWPSRGELVEHAAYREVPTGRTGWFLGLATVTGAAPVLVFRSRDDGELFTHSELDTLRGVAFEELG